MREKNVSLWRVCVKTNSHESLWLTTKIQKLCSLYVDTRNYRFSCHVQVRSPEEEVLTGMLSELNTSITVNFIESNFLIENLTAVISLGNCPDLTGLWLAIQNSNVIHHLSQCLFHSCALKGKPRCSSELVDESSTEIFYCWLVGRGQIFFHLLENCHSNFLVANLCVRSTPNSF